MLSLQRGNIGAEGQYILAPLPPAAWPLLADKTTGGWIVPGCCWLGWPVACPGWGLTALLRDRFHANEILVSLMLVYVAVRVLGYLVFGP